MPAETDHHLGGTKHFECRVKGHPRPVIRWFKDGTEITLNSRYQFDHSHEGVISMVIEDITHEDEGHYRCKAENSQGLASTSAYLFVRAHKEHSEEPGTSIHAMEIEEVVIKPNGGKSPPTEKVSEPHFETPIEDVDEPHSDDQELSREEEEIVKKSFESVIESAESTRLISSSSLSDVGSTREEHDKESSKISQDTLEKDYQSSDDLSEDVDVIRPTIDSEMSLGSTRDSSMSLLMRKTERILSEDFSSDGEGSISLSELSTSESESVIKRSGSVKGKTESTLTETRMVKTQESSSLEMSSVSETKSSTKMAVETEVDTSSTSGSKSINTEVLEVTAKQNDSGFLESSVLGSPKAEKSATLTTSASQVEEAASKSQETNTDEVIQGEVELKEKVGKYEKTVTSEEKVEDFEGRKSESSEDFVDGVETSEACKLAARQESKEMDEAEEIERNVGNSFEKGDGDKQQQGRDVSELLDEKISDLDGMTEQAAGQETSWVDQVTAEAGMEKSEASEDDAKGDNQTHSKPKLVQEMADTSVEVGKTLRLRSQVQGTPRPELHWSREEVVIQEGERITIISEDDVTILEIREVREADAGTYRLTARNSEGQIFSEVLVTVHGSDGSTAGGSDSDEIRMTASVNNPQFISRPSDVVVAEMDKIKLVCSVKGTPAPKVTWEKDGRKLRANRNIRLYEADGCHCLEIRECDVTDAGEYICTAINNEGTTTASVYVTMEGMERTVSVSEDAEELLGATASSAPAATDLSSDVCSADTRTVRYLKLVGMAAIFSLASFGVKKLMDNVHK